MFKNIYKNKPILHIGGKNAYFIGCMHHYHSAIIKYCGRLQFLPKEQQDELLNLKKKE